MNAALSNNTSGGIFKLARQDLAALKQAAAELKQACLMVNLADAKTVPGFIEAISRDLSFPEWFGGNLDALHDCLTDLSWLPASGYVIVLDRFSALQGNPTSFAVLNAVLSSVVEEWQTRNVPLKIFYLEDEC